MEGYVNDLYFDVNVPRAILRRGVLASYLAALRMTASAGSLQIRFIRTSPSIPG
jgi:hypothetical protein